VKTEEELLEYYKEEIESGEVKKEELLLLYEALKEDFNYQNPKRFNEIVTKNTENIYGLEAFLYKYTLKLQYNFNELIRWQLDCEHAGATEIEKGERIKRYISQLLYTKGFKDINY